MKKVTVGVVLFGDKYLADSLPSLLNQDYPNIEYIIRDQEEGKYSAYEFITKNFPEIFKKARVQKGKNAFHSGGHNAIIREMSGDIYFCCSNDMLYPPDLVSKMVKYLEENPEYTVATCKLMRWLYSENKQKSDFIDSFGLGARCHHHFYDIGQGEEDKGQYDSLNDPFGVSGAFCVLTKEALESIRYKDEYFDALLHYKNDVDLSYRLRWAGNKVLFVPEIKIYHDRQVATHSQKSLWVKQSSYLGEKVLMAKNYSKEFPPAVRVKTTGYHFLKTAYLLAKTPKLFETVKFLREHKGEIQAKRDAIKRKLNPIEIAKQMK